MVYRQLEGVANYVENKRETRCQQANERGQEVISSITSTLYGPMTDLDLSLLHLFPRQQSRKRTVKTAQQQACFATLISSSRQGDKEPSQRCRKKVQRFSEKVQRFSKNVGVFFENDGHFLTTLGDLCHTCLFFEEITPKNLVNHRKHYKFATQRWQNPPTRHIQKVGPPMRHLF